MMWKSTSSSG